MSDGQTDVTMDELVSLCKRRGYIFQGSDVYGGLAGTWDYGPLGVQLKKNLVDIWWKTFVLGREDMHAVDAAILMNQKVWQASGHVHTFADPLTECINCHARYRADKIDMSAACPSCGKKMGFTKPEQFNMMFKTVVGPKFQSWTRKRSGGLEGELFYKNSTGERETAWKIEDTENELGGAMVYDSAAVSYLRPETAQGIFTNYKNVLDTVYPDIPFGIAQHGKAFRNEISPRDFIFRSREFEQMEIEYFVHPDNWSEQFDRWVSDIELFLKIVGIRADKVYKIEVPEKDRAHYSKRTIDFEFDFPIGREELLGLAYRTNYDLSNIQEHSGRKMDYRPKDGSKSFLPHVIEPSMGVERLIMAILSSAYTKDSRNDEERVFLKLPVQLAPIRAAVSPLLKNKPELVAKARNIYKILKQKYGNISWDDNSNVGKRYRRQDEIGTPYCVTIDFQTLDDDTVTVRDRDTTDQYRIGIQRIESALDNSPTR